MPIVHTCVHNVCTQRTQTMISIQIVHLLLSCVSICALSHGYISSSFRRYLMETPEVLQALASKCTIEIHNHVCLNGATKSDGTRNGIGGNRLDNQKNEVPGTTVWINEWMAPGHMDYDLQFLQILHSAPVERIVLQRAPCFRKDFCEGITYWNSFFKGMYAAAVLSANATKTKLMLRMHPHENNWHAERLVPESLWPTSLTSPTSPAQQIDHIQVQDTICFERLIRRSYSNGCLPHCGGNLGLCFAHALTPEVAHKLKIAAYQLVAAETNTPASLFPISLSASSAARIRTVIIAHRTGIKRGMADPETLFRRFKDHFESADTTRIMNNKRTRIVLHDTRNTSTTYLDQMQLMAESDVVICTHGAFVGNLVYLRDEAMLIELSGVYENSENTKPFEELARLFNIQRIPMVISDLSGQDKVNYAINEREIQQLLKQVTEFLQAH